MSGGTLTGSCPIGPLGLHTANYERTECIWCGPGRQAWKPGRWVDLGDGKSAWTVIAPAALADPTETGGGKCACPHGTESNLVCPVHIAPTEEPQA